MKFILTETTPLNKEIIINAGRRLIDRIQSETPLQKSDIIEDIQKIKHAGTLKERREFLSSKDAIRLIHNELVYKQVHEIHSRIPEFRIGTGQRELEWISQILKHHSTTLKQFIIQKEEFDMLFLAKKYKEAKTHLELLIKNFGWSLAALERKLAVHIALEDYAESNALLTRIVESPQNDIIKFIACAFHYNHHPLMRAEYFSRLLDNNIHQAKVDPRAEVFMRILIQKGYYPALKEDETLAATVYNIGKFPIVDQYELLLHILQHIDRLEVQYPAAYTAIQSLRNEIADERLNILLASKKETNELVEVLSGRHRVGMGKTLNSHYADEISIRLKSIDIADNSPAELTEIERWVDRQFRHPLTIGFKVFIEAIRGGKAKDGLSRMVLKSVEIEKIHPHHFNTIADFIASIKTCHQNGGVLNAYLSFNDYIDNFQSKGVKEHCELTIEAATQAPLLLAQLAASSHFVETISTARLTKEEDIAILLAYTCLGNSPMEISIRLEELLMSLKLRKPSEVIKAIPASEITEDFAIHCCNIDVLEQLPSVGPNEPEVIEERLTILRYLSSNYNTETKIVNDEISRLIKQQKLDSLFTIVEDSRLRVNTLALVEKLKPLYKDVTRESLNENLDGIHLNILGSFLLDEEHGLDAELSNRIRHGKLRERLLSPFLSNDIISPTASVNEAISALGITLRSDNSDSRDLIKAILHKLSVDIETQVLEFVNEKAHLKLQEHSWQGFPGLLTSKITPKGLICVTKLRTRSYAILKEGDSQIPDIDYILEKSIESIWAALDEQLVEVKYSIAGDVQAALNKSIQLCEIDLQSMHAAYNANKFARCKYDIASVCREVARWFSIPAKIEFPESPLGDIIELATKAVELCSVDLLKVFIDEQTKLKIVPSNMVGDVYDLLFLILSNCTKHGRAFAQQDLQVNVTRQEDEITIINYCGSNSELNAAEANRLLTEYTEEGINNALNREGKSGIAKIVRLLRKLTKTATPAMTISSNEGHFSIKFKLNIK